MCGMEALRPKQEKNSSMNQISTYERGYKNNLRRMGVGVILKALLLATTFSVYLYSLVMFAKAEYLSGQSTRGNVPGLSVQRVIMIRSP